MAAATIAPRARAGHGGGRPPVPRSRRVLVAALLALTACALTAPLQAQPIQFRQAIEMALRHSGMLRAALAERTRTKQEYKAQHDAYYPTVVFGSGLGYSFGQPIAVAGQAPSIFNITHSQTIFDLAQGATIQAAKSDVRAARIGYRKSADQVILDTAVLYVQLNSNQRQLQAARKQKEAADRALDIVRQREQAGVASAIDSKHAELDDARVALRIATLQSNEDTLRARLALAIGQAALQVAIVPDSIPALPAAADGKNAARLALANSLSVRLADEHARAAHDRARAEHRRRYPSISLDGQYAEFADFNNYSDYYKQFSRHNYSFGVNIRIPIFNLAQNAAAAAADAAAMKADADAQAARDAAAAEAVRSSHSLQKMQAASRVSQLELEVSQANIDAVQLKIEQGTASPSDEAMARAEVASRRVDLLESRFEYERARLQLMRQTGELRDWALGQ